MNKLNRTSKSAMPFSLNAVVLVLMVALLLLMVSCAGLTEADRARLPIQYGTMKVIGQSDAVTADGVIRYTTLARELIDRDVSINTTALASEIVQALGAERLSPTDLFLVTALVQQIEVEMQSLNLIQPDVRLSLLEVLGWIEQAARMSGSST